MVPGCPPGEATQGTTRHVPHLCCPPAWEAFLPGTTKTLTIFLLTRTAFVPLAHSQGKTNRQKPQTSTHNQHHHHTTTTSYSALSNDNLG